VPALIADQHVDAERALMLSAKSPSSGTLTTTTPVSARAASTMGAAARTTTPTATARGDAGGSSPALPAPLAPDRRPRAGEAHPIAAHPRRHRPAVDAGTCTSADGAAPPGQHLPTTARRDAASS
jgi:hypothetical protein